MQLYRRAHQAIAVLVAALVGGCATSGGGVVRSAGSGSQIPVTEAFITPPPGGPAIIAVLETRYRNGLAQDIVLENNSANAGQNVISVRAYGPMGRDAGVGDLGVDQLRLGDVTRELARQFPGVRMEVSGLYVQNKYGPFSYATGRSRTGANCVYAWQRIAAEPRVFAFKRGSLTWRMRVCDDASDARSLLLLAYGLTINGYFQSETWDPYTPPLADPRIGAPGVVILPEQVVDPTVVPPSAFGEGPATSAASRAGASGRRSRPRTAARPSFVAGPAPQPTVLNRPVAGAAIVPRPESTDLSEPRVDTSNLPQTGAGSARPRAVVPVPSPPSAPPAPQGFRPTSLAPIPAAKPRVSAAQDGGPSVRLVELSR